MAPPAPLTKIHWNHFQLKQSSIGIITANSQPIAAGVALRVQVAFELCA
jgi:hypothetical protein